MSTRAATASRTTGFWMRRRAPGKARVLAIVLLCFGVALQLYPLLWMVLSALKPEREITVSPLALPSSLHFENFLDAWAGGASKALIGRYFLNSLIVTAITVPILLFFAAMAGYGLARFHAFGSRAYFGLLLVLIAIPAHAFLLPLYFLMADLGLLSNYLGLVLVYVALGLPFSAILLRSFFLNFPKEILEAALVDGCTQFGAFWRVVLPIARGALAAVAINNILWIWNELLFALVIMNRVEMKTLPLGISTFRSEYTVDWRLTYAALVIASLPPLILFLLLQRHITKGMTLGAVK
jgi:raffinose/stachyose/melibiose transport system permease protein